MCTILQLNVSKWNIWHVLFFNVHSHCALCQVVVLNGMVIGLHVLVEILYLK